MAAGSTDPGVPPPPPVAELERATSVSSGPGRRRVGALLDAYYGLEGGGQTPNRLVRNGSVASFGSGGGSLVTSLAELDKESFDSQQFFDSLVAGASVADVVRKANTIDAETKDLDGDMQMVCYENYSKFIRATELNNQMISGMAGLEPDMRGLQTSFKSIVDLQGTVDGVVSERSRQVETLLKHQQLCKKLKVLFNLPTTLQRCLERGAYGEAVKAYCSCVEFLRQHKDIKTFRVVLDDVEHQMGRIQTALEKRLLSSELNVEEALATATTLLLLGQESAKVSKDFLSGRSAALREALAWCFPTDSADNEEVGIVERAFTRATQRFIPDISDSVDGFQSAWRDRPTPGLDESLEKFVNARIEDLFDRLSTAVTRHSPPSQTLVSCVHSVRDSLRRLHSLMPRLLTRLFTAFQSRVANNAVEALFTSSAIAALDEVAKLHGACRVPDDAETPSVEITELVSRTEKSIVSLCLSALNDMQPLKALVGEEPDKATGKQLSMTLRDQLTAFFRSLSAAAEALVSQEVLTDSLLVEGVKSRCQEFHHLDFVATFVLILMRTCQQLEEKAVAKAWTLANDLIGLGSATADASIGKGLRSAAEQLIGHYVLIVGQKLAHFFRNATESTRWMSAKEPKEPSLVIEMVFKEVQGCDAELARTFCDQRNARGARNRPRFLTQTKDSMELEVDRLWAKKVQAYAPVPSSRDGVVAAILRIAFKALYEYAREKTFNKFGLQQMQVDCAMLAELARDCVDGEDIHLLEAVLGEVLNSVTQRCVEPELLEAAAVAAICDEKKRKLRLE